jgi:dihydrofolate reductase
LLIPCYCLIDKLLLILFAVSVYIPPIIAALQVSVEGFIEGPNGEMDWVMVEDEETWKDLFEMLAHVDTFILGRKTYPSYEQYWLAVLTDPATRVD